LSSLAQQHIAEINANPDATQEERQAAIEKVNAAVAAANTNILNASFNLCSWLNGLYSLNRICLHLLNISIAISI
jgi:hypothetical protein